MQKESTDKAILIHDINLIEGMTQYLITDNPIIENTPILKQQAENISTQLLSLKNNIK